MTWDFLLHWTKISLCVLVCILPLISIICIAFAERNAKPVDDDQFTPEEPWLEPIITQKAQGERFRDLEERA